MRTVLLTLLLLLGTFAPLRAQKPTPANPPLTPTNMNNHPEEAHMMEYLHVYLQDAVPNTRLLTDQQLKRDIGKTWQKGVRYGFDNEEDLFAYVVAAFALRQVLAEESPEALRILQDNSTGSRRKAQRFEAFVKQTLAAREQAAPEEPRQDLDIESLEESRKAGRLSEAAYLAAQREAQPYRRLAQWTVNQLRRGDAAAVLEKYSPNGLAGENAARVERLLKEQVLPVFVASTGVEESPDLGQTRDGFGSEGYAFFMTLQLPKGVMPVLVVIVQENNQLVIGGLAHAD